MEKVVEWMGLVEGMFFLIVNTLQVPIYLNVTVLDNWCVCYSNKSLSDINVEGDLLALVTTSTLSNQNET